MNMLSSNLLASSKTKILVIELNNKIINNYIFQDIFNNRALYNVYIIGTINPLNICSKLNFDMIIIYDVINSVCIDNNIYNTIYNNVVTKKISCSSFLRSIEINNRYIIYNK